METEKLFVQLQCQINGGKKYYYPINEIAACFCKLLNQKTITLENIYNIKLLGFQVTITGDTKNGN